MKKIVIKTLLGGLIGLVTGYLIYARQNGQLVSIERVLFPARDTISNISDSISGLDSIRRNLLNSALIGAVTAAIVTILNLGQRSRN